MSPMEHLAVTKIPVRIQMPARMVFVLEDRAHAAPARVTVIKPVSDALPTQDAAPTAAVFNRVAENVAAVRVNYIYLLARYKILFHETR